jgi:hypothetical protein
MEGVMLRMIAYGMLIAALSGCATQKNEWDDINYAKISCGEQYTKCKTSDDALSAIGRGKGK